MERGSAAEDKPQVEWIERRLRDAGAHEIRTESFRFQRRPWRYIAHGAPVSARCRGRWRGRRRGSPRAPRSRSRARPAATAAGRVGCSLRARASTSSRAFPPPASASARSCSSRTTTPQPTGLLWRLPRPRSPFLLPAQMALAVVALGCVLGSRVLRALGGVGVGRDGAARPRPGARPDRARRERQRDRRCRRARAGRRVRARSARAHGRGLVFTDCEEMGLGGDGRVARGARRRARPRAGRSSSALDTLGSGEPAVVTRDGALTANVLERGTRLGRPRRAARGGRAAAPDRRSSRPTDPIVAQHAGLHAVSIVSCGADGTLGPHYHLPSDTPENVDYDSVEQCTRLAAGIARVWDAAS